MGQQVSIDRILINRTLEPGRQDVTKLAKHIHDSGLQIPVLVNQDYELIDGLRRIEAVRSLGNETIEVVAVTMFGPAVTWIQRAREHGAEATPLGPRRLWELYNACRPLIAISRSREMKGTAHGRGVHINGRRRFLDAIGIDSESYLQAVTQLYRMAQEDSVQGNVAREYTELVEREQMSPYMALEHVRTRQRRGDIVKADDQVALLTNAVSTINGIGYSIEQLGPINQAVDREILADAAKELRKFRRTVHQLIHILEKEQESR